MYQFGSGNLFAITQSGGQTQGRRFGVLQEVSVDISFNTKELYGQQQFPVAIARGQGKIEGKAKYANIFANVWNEAFFGLPVSAGQTIAQLNEAATIPSAGGNQIVVANSSTFVRDLGIVFADTGQPLRKIAGPDAFATGTYKDTAGLGMYNFAAADANRAVLISYQYTAANAGSRMTITNQLSGHTPTIQLAFPMSYEGKQLHLHFNRVILPKLSFGTKLEDFVVPEVDFKAFADDAGNIGFVSFAE